MGGVFKWMVMDNFKFINYYCDLLVVDEVVLFFIFIFIKCVVVYVNWLLGIILYGYEGSGRGFVLRLLFKL